MTAVGEVAEQNLRELATSPCALTAIDGVPVQIHMAGPVPNAIARRCTEVCCLKEKMNQVAVVIGGGQTLGEFLCRRLAARATAWR